MPRGGYRPGAGRKKKTTVNEQVSRRTAVLEVVNDAAWRRHVRKLLALSDDGNPGPLQALYPFILGSAKQELTVTFDVQQVAKELAAEYGVEPERVISLHERLKQRREA